MATNLNHSVYSRVRGVKGTRTHLAKFMSLSAARSWAQRYSSQCHGLVTVIVYDIDNHIDCKFERGALV